MSLFCWAPYVWGIGAPLSLDGGSISHAKGEQSKGVYFISLLETGSDLVQVLALHSLWSPIKVYKLGKFSLHSTAG